jgi:hypothetical protein
MELTLPEPVTAPSASARREKTKRREDGMCVQCGRHVAPDETRTGGEKRGTLRAFCAVPPTDESGKALYFSCAKAHQVAAQVRAKEIKEVEDAARSQSMVQTAYDAGRVDGEQAAVQRSGEPVLSVAVLGDEHVRIGGVYSAETASTFNTLALENMRECWDKTRLTFSMQLTSMQSLLTPFLALNKLERSLTDKNYGHVLLPTEPPTLLRNKEGSPIGGFQGYSSVQSTLTAIDRDREQRRRILSFLTWRKWRESIPDCCLPEGFTSSKQWALQFEAALMVKLAPAVKKLKMMHPLEKLEIVFIHVLNQKHGVARFTWHRDTEENDTKYRVLLSLVVLLEKTGKVPGMRMGSAEVANYEEVGDAHLFDSSLFHITEEVEGADCVKLGIFFGVYRN